MLLKNVTKIGKFREVNATSPSRGTINVDINLMVDDYKERFRLSVVKTKESNGKGQSEQRNHTKLKIAMGLLT